VISEVDPWDIPGREEVLIGCEQLEREKINKRGTNFKYVGTAVKNQNYISDKIKRKSIRRMLAIFLFRKFCLPISNTRSSGKN
jgi:hypothetical protein